MENPLLFGILVFAGVVLLIEGLFLAARGMRRREGERVRRRLRQFAQAHQRAAATDITRQRVYSEVPWLNRLILQVAKVRRLSQLIEQANAPYTVGFYLLLAALCAALGAVASIPLKIGPGAGVVLAVVGASLPFLYLLVKKKARMDKFEEQFPGALDLLARAMRAGHAFTSALKMVADEFEDPMGPEFARVIEEINFGVPLPEALGRMTERVRSQDLRYFVVAVIVQRETGGNLAEIVEKIASLIRERFVLKGKIRALSAEGRLSAVVLALLPICLALYFFFAQPAYIQTLALDPMGHVMVAGALVMMILGILVMHRMVQIKV